jgi:hypothetical protein
MSILNYNNNQIIKPFLQNLLKDKSKNLNFSNSFTKVRKKACPQDSKPLEFVIVSHLIKAAPYLQTWRIIQGLSQIHGCAGRISIYYLNLK